MVHQPSTMLLDEPLGKLDAMTREAIRSDLQKLWMRHSTVVFVTHSIEEAVQLPAASRPSRPTGAHRADHRHRSALPARL